MGYINNSVINLKSKLTPYGRQRLITNNNLSITKFALGDSDNNYNVFEPLAINEVPDISGDNNGLYLYNGGYNQDIKDKIFYKQNLQFKSIEPQNKIISEEFVELGFKQINLTDGNFINRNDINTDRLTNLFYSFNLPINNLEANKFNSINLSNGGFSDTTLKFLENEEILVIPIPSLNYGEIIDGKSIKLELQTNTGSPTLYEIYSTYSNKNDSLKLEDSRYYETFNKTSFLGDNIALLFCDDIVNPNNDNSKSWSTGYGTKKPFSANKKPLYNFTTNNSLGRVMDESVGVVYLDKGFIVITNTEIINSVDLPLSGSTITYNSIIKDIKQNITCIANRNEFFNSNNRTFSFNDSVRITEIGLYDNLNRLVAIAKPPKTFTKRKNEVLIFDISIKL